MKELSVICKINLLNLNSVASFSTSSAAVRTGIFSGTGAALSVNFHKEQNARANVLFLTPMSLA